MPRGSKPGERRGGRGPGTPNKITMNVVSALDRLGCDPLELSAKIALGEELDGPHPSLKAFYAFADKLAGLEDTGGAVTPELIEELRGLIDDNLTRGYVPMELRSKHIADLMRYLYPTRRAIEVKAEIAERRPPMVDPSKLSDEAIRELVGARVGEAVGTVVDAEVTADDE